MRRFALIGIAAFLLLLLVRAPAGLLRLAVPDGGPVALLQLRGTLWDGTTTLLIDGVSAGELTWSLRPGAFLQGGLGYDLALSGPDVSVSGTTLVRPGTAQLALQGDLQAPFLNAWLERYDIFLSGTFSFIDTRFDTSGRYLTGADGAIQWSGGPVRYILSGKLSNASLPAMNALLGPGPGATVYPDRGQIPVLTAEMLQNGYVRIGMTKYLTRLLDNPWPGTDPDHAVVLEVEEQLF